ncbi:hypothetical protein QTH87_05990 [Variovorax sp. J22P168]|uniref:hypothetical protein n=1 Tax=Variovorax jilinensis TaxID=3053513 RepID=UPI002576E59B|nr:hypothetical protein [Variovorax sp. J22P168]MDM0011989.1 hypothetical protein [Variovorax sp. J22P168]
MVSTGSEFEMRFLANVEQALAEVRKMERGIGASLEGITKAAKFAAGALAAVGLSVSVSAISGWVREAIEAAEATGKLGQKAGIATKDVAGLQLAFGMAGVNAAGMQTAMAKLSVGITGGSRALEQLGIKTRTASGAYRDTKDILYDVADSFAELKTGAAKSTLAVEIFGRSGTDLIPLLDGGAEGLRDMAEMAERLGLVIDDQTATAAGSFNDTLNLLQEAGRGVSTQLAAQLLPTLNSIAGAFFDTLTQGDGLRKVADFLAASLKILYTVGIGIVQVFKTVGTTLAAAAAQVAALLRRDFAGATAIGNEWMADMKDDAKSTAAQIEKVWSGAGDSAVSALAANARRTKEIQLQTEAQRAGANRAAADADAAASARIKAADKAILEARKTHFEDIALAVRLGTRTELEAIEAQLAREEEVFARRTALANAELSNLRTRANSLKDQEGVLARLAEIERNHVEARRKAAADTALLDKRESDALEARYQDAGKAADAAESAVRMQRRQAQLLGVEYAHAAKGAGASNYDLVESLAALERSWAYDTAAQIERRAEMERGRDLSGETTEALLRQAAAMRELADMQYGAAMRANSIETLKAIDAYLDPAKAKDFGTALRDSFGEAGNALAQMANALQDFAQKQAQLGAMQKALAEDKSINAADRLVREMQLAKASAALQVSGYASIAGAAKGLFKDHSKGYKAMQAAEKAFRAVEIAMALESTAKKVLGITQVVAATAIGEQAKSNAITQGVDVQLAADQVKGQSAAVVGVATQAQGDPYSAWARMAAMAAVMAAMGFAVRGAGGSGGGDSYTTPVAGTGTVLGAEGQQSKSIGNAIELLAANSRIELPLTQRMLSVMSGVRDGIAGLGSVVARSQGLRGGTATAASISGAELIDSGIAFSPQTIGDMIAKGVQGHGYTVNWAKKKGASASYTALDAALTGSMQSMVIGMVDAVATAAHSLRLDDPDMMSRILSIMPDLGDTSMMRMMGIAGGGMVSLKGKSGKEAQDELEALFSSLGDQIARAAVPSLAAFQRVGEGMFETLLRVAADVEKAEYALEKFGVAAIDYTQVLNKSGDLATEIVRQSVAALEYTASGALTGVGQIIEVFTGSYDELIDLYRVLSDVRGAMRSVGAAGADLSAAMVRGAGGIEALQTGLQDYFDGFFTEVEQRAANAARLAEEFARVGVAVPVSKEAFRALVESLDTSTDAGANLFGQLMQLSGQFAEVADAAAAAADAQAQAAISAAQSAADAWRSVANGLRGDIERLHADSQNLVDPMLRYARGLAQLDRDVVQALAGDIEAARRVGASATGFLQAAERTSATRADYLRDRALTEAKLGAVLEQAEEQADIQQVIADASARQVFELQSINANLVDFARAVLAGRAVGSTLPAFAEGGMHAGGLRLVGERGWEIEATGPSRIWNQDQLADALSGSAGKDDGEGEGDRIWRRPQARSTGSSQAAIDDRIVQRLDALIAECIRGNDEGRVGDAAIAEMGLRTHRLLDRLSDGGDALRTRDSSALDAPPTRARVMRASA